MISFYYGSGSAKAKSYGSYGSGSATLDSTYSEKVTDLDKAHHGHEQPHHRHLDLDLGVTSEIFTIRVNKTSLILFLSFVSAILYIVAFSMFTDKLQLFKQYIFTPKVGNRVSHCLKLLF